MYVYITIWYDNVIIIVAIVMKMWRKLIQAHRMELVTIVTVVKNVLQVFLYIMSHFLEHSSRYCIITSSLVYNESWGQVDLAGDAPVFKEGEIYRKNVMEGPNKKGN